MCLHKRSVVVALFLLAMALWQGNAVLAAQRSSVDMKSLMKNSSIEDFGKDTRVFTVDPAIMVYKVHFQNRYGISVTGDLYLPKQFSAQKHYAALVLSGPFGAVKE